MPVKIFVGNLNPNSDSSSLREKFETYGRVTECDIVANYGFVHMANESEANEAIRNLHETMFDGMQMRCELSTARTQGRKRAREDTDKPSDSRGRGGRGGRGGSRGGRGDGKGRGYGDRYDPYRDERPPPPARGRGRDPYIDRRYPEDPYARDPYARDPYARDPYARDPYARDPYARDPYARDPYARDPYARDPYARDPYARDPYARDPYARDPYARERDPYAAHSRDPYADRDPYASARDPYARPPPDYYDDGRAPPRRPPPGDDPYLDRYERSLPARSTTDSAYPETSESGADSSRSRAASTLAPVSYPAPRNGTAGQPQQTSLYTDFGS